MNKKKNYFISIEGVEGVGKSTIIEFMLQVLARQKINVTLTREPGGTPVAEAIRSVLLGHYDEPMASDTELLLMFAGRVQNIQQVIRPELAKGKWVISDRFTDASFAYQGGGRGIDHVHIANLAKWVQGDLMPDITFLLDAPVEVGLKRIKSRGAKDRIEKEGVDFFRRVRQSYLQLAEAEPQRFRVIKAEQPLEQVKRAVLLELERLY